MGLSVEPVEGTDESQPIEIEDQDENSQSECAIQDNPASSDQSGNLFQGSSADNDNFIDNEMLMETDGTVIDNL